MTVNETYKMEYKCLNCGTIHNVDVPKGVEANGYRTKCLYCGETRPFKFSNEKPATPDSLEIE